MLCDQKKHADFETEETEGTVTCLHLSGHKKAPWMFSINQNRKTTTQNSQKLIDANFETTQPRKDSRKIEENCKTVNLWHPYPGERFIMVY